LLKYIVVVAKKKNSIFYFIFLKRKKITYRNRKEECVEREIELHFVKFLFF
jgi:hypothetical protein